MTAKWNGSAWAIGPLPTLRMVGAGTEEPEEAEEPVGTEQKDNSLAAMMQRVATEPDHVREAIFRDLKEFRRRKKLNPWVGRQEQERLGMRAEMDSILQEVVERSKREIPNGGTMATNASNVISYVGNGKLVKGRAAARRRTRKDENGPKPFTQEDQERINRTRDRRLTRTWWLKRLQAIDEGTEIVTKEQFLAHMAIGRSKGWLRPPSKR